MRVVIAAIGRARPSPERELTQTYGARFDALCRPLGFKPMEILEIEEKKAGPDLKAREGARLLETLPPGGKSIALDERGKALGSQALAQRLANWRDEGVPACTFFIGGADGLDRELVKKTDLTLSLGAATWPHMLVRAMIAEQIYRAGTILAGHPYHRE